MPWHAALRKGRSLAPRQSPFNILFLAEKRQQDSISTAPSLP
jgi:hypothetical protein